jgi:hypothetical protein
MWYGKQSSLLIAFFSLIYDSQKKLAQHRNTRRSIYLLRVIHKWRHTFSESYTSILCNGNEDTERREKSHPRNVPLLGVELRSSHNKYFCAISCATATSFIMYYRHKSLIPLRVWRHLWTIPSNKTFWYTHISHLQIAFIIKQEKVLN